MKGCGSVLGMDIGVDFGSSKTVICTPKREVILQEPTAIAVETARNRTITCGQDAWEMVGRSPDSIRVIRPIRGGVIAEYEYAEKILREFIHRVCQYKIVKPRAVLTVSSGVTEVEQRSVLEAASMAGLRQAVLLDKGVAAAIGAGLDIGGPKGVMLVHIGAGSTDLVVMSLNGVAVSRSIRVGGDDLNTAIIHYLRNRYRLIVGELTAERVKLAGACAQLPKEKKTVAVPGLDALTGLPRVQKITSDYLMEAIAEPVEEILQQVCEVLEITPPELAGDIMSDGITLAGGGALLPGLLSVLADVTGVPCRLAPQPMLCAGLGAGVAMTLLDKLPTHVFDISEYTYQLSHSVRQ